MSSRGVDVMLPSVTLSLDRAQPCMLPLLSTDFQGKQKCFCEQIKMVPLFAAAKKDLCTILLYVQRNMSEEIALMEICVKVFLSN